MAIEIAPDQEIWVMTKEGAELTGYNSRYLEQLASKNSRLPEDERDIKVRKRGGRHELWLPDLLRYIEKCVSDAAVLCKRWRCNFPAGTAGRLPHYRLGRLKEAQASNNCQQT